MYIQSNMMLISTFIVGSISVLKVKFSSPKNENNLIAITKVMSCEITFPVLFWKYTPRLLREIPTSSKTVTEFFSHHLLLAWLSLLFLFDPNQLNASLRVSQLFC